MWSLFQHVTGLALGFLFLFTTQSLTKPLTYNKHLDDIDYRTHLHVDNKHLDDIDYRTHLHVDNKHLDDIDYRTHLHVDNKTRKSVTSVQHSE